MTEKSCTPYCSISCVHQVAMLDEVRERPRETLNELISRRREADPNFQPPFLLRAAAWTFLNNPAASALSRAAGGLFQDKASKK